MNLVFLLSIFILCYGRGTSRPEVVNIGAIFSFDTINARVSKIAIKAAEQEVNSDTSILGGTKLSITFQDSNFSGFLGIIGALRSMESDTVAIIGPQSAVMAHLLSHIANELHVPMLSFTALDPSLTPMQYPYFVQTAPNDHYQMTAIADMVSHFGWSKVVAIFTDDDQSRNGVASLGNRLNERHCRISHKAVLPPDQKATVNEIKDQLERICLMETRVIILHTYSGTGLKVFNAAKELGMMENGYVWISSTWLSTILDSTSPLSPKTANSIKGAIALRPHTADSKRKRDFILRWNRLSGGSIGLNPYGLYAYDTVWMIAHALELLLNKGGNISFSSLATLSNLDGGGAVNVGALRFFDGGEELLNNILKTNMSGLTGPLQFHPERSLENPSYEIINVIGKGYRQIGYWTNNSGLSVRSSEILYAKPTNHYSVVWPGGTINKPRGWVFPNNGTPLRIGVPNRVTDQINSTDIVQRYWNDIFNAAIKLLPYEVPYRFIKFGDGQKNPNYNELLNMVASGVFDAAVGDIDILPNRARIVDFSHPYTESGLVVVAPVRKLNSSPWTFLWPFSPTMWAAASGFILIIGVVMWILEHRTNNEFRGPPKKQIKTILWFGFSTMFFTHRENPGSSLGRFVLLIWLFVVLTINSSYTASLTSILTVQQLSSPITGIDSLLISDEPIGYHLGSVAQNYLTDQLNIPKSRLLALKSSEEVATTLEKGIVAAVVGDRVYIDLFLSKHCMFAVRGQEFTSSGWGFAFPKGSPLATDISTAILTLSENGELQRIHDKWLSKKACVLKSSNLQSERLPLQSFWVLFVTCGCVCIFALFMYTCSMVRKFNQHCSEDSESSRHGSSHLDRFVTFLSFIDKKKDQTIKTSKRKRKNTL